MLKLVFIIKVRSGGILLQTTMNGDACASAWFISEKDTCHTCAHAPTNTSTRKTQSTILPLLLLVGGRQKKSCLQAPLLSLLLLPLLPSPSLLIPLSHRTGSAYSAAPESREWGEKGYYDSEERKEREREKRRADRVL